jgi:hypothetical protein
MNCSEAANQRQLEDDEQSHGEVPRELSRRARCARVPRAGAGAEEERRRADVRDEAREEQRYGRRREVRRVRAERPEEVARVVERHDHHDDAAQDVDGFDAVTHGVRYEARPRSGARAVPFDPKAVRGFGHGFW